MLIFTATARSGFAAEKPVVYGPFVIQTAAEWLPDYLNSRIVGYHFRPSATPAILTKLRDLAYEFRDTHLNKVTFRPSGDPVFVLREGQPPRMAVTGTNIDSEVIFNLGLISDPRTFNFGDALALWIHELGHKLPRGAFTQEQIDTVAAEFRRDYAAQMEIHSYSGIDFLILNPAPYLGEGEVLLGPRSGIQTPIPSVFAVLNGNEFFDLSQKLYSELDRFTFPQTNIIEKLRPIVAFVPLKESDNSVELRLQLRTSRVPKNLNYYVGDEMGPNYFKGARLKLTRDLRSLDVTHYQNESTPRPLIDDASAEVSAPEISADGLELKLALKMYLQTKNHFHAAGYPDSRMTLLAMLDGSPVRIEVRARWDLNSSDLGMPHDVYNKPTEKMARLTASFDHLPGEELQIIGVQDRFFTLGRGWVSPEDEQKRVRLREPLSIQLPPSCAAMLR